jgi:hypothetical protein
MIESDNYMWLVKVIETNCYFDKSGNQIEFQSRIIKVTSWDEYVSEIREGKFVVRVGLFGGLHGSSLPRNAEISNFWNDDFHLGCKVISVLGNETHKLAYLIKEQE